MRKASHQYVYENVVSARTHDRWHTNSQGTNTSTFWPAELQRPYDCQPAEVFPSHNDLECMSLLIHFPQNIQILSPYGLCLQPNPRSKQTIINSEIVQLLVNRIYLKWCLSNTLSFSEGHLSPNVSYCHKCWVTVDYHFLCFMRPKH